MLDSIYILPFLKAFLVSLSLSLLIIFLPWKNYKRKSSRHIHSKKISRLGGVAIIIGFIFTILSDSNLVITSSIWGIIIASLIIFIYGIWDDFKQLDWKLQLFFQLCTAVIIFIVGVQIEYITNPLGGILDFSSGNIFILSLFLGIGWVLLLMNSMNWLDGIDGLSGGTTFIAALVIFFLILKPEVNQPPMGIMSMALAGSVLGFLVLNFNPSLLLAGTSGSVFMGFILATLSIFAGAKIATALLVLSIPIIDVFFVIIERIKDGRSVFKPDKNHFHHKLLELGWSQRKISLFFYIITAIIGVIALNTRELGKFLTILLVFIIMTSMFFYLKHKVQNEKY